MLFHSSCSLIVRLSNPCFTVGHEFEGSLDFCESANNNREVCRGIGREREQMPWSKRRLGTSISTATLT